MSITTAPTPAPLISRTSGYRPRTAYLRAWDRPDPRPMEPQPTVLAPSLVLETEVHARAATIVVTGELCRGACHELERLAERIFLAGATALDIDLADVTLVDAGGLRQLRRVVELAALCDAPAQLSNPSPPVARALEVAGLTA